MPLVVGVVGSSVTLRMVDTGAGSGSSRMGDSGGGGISVPSVREKLSGVNAGSSNRPLAGIVVD